MYQYKNKKPEQTAFIKEIRHIHSSFVGMEEVKSSLLIWPPRFITNHISGIGLFVINPSNHVQHTTT